MCGSTRLMLFRRNAEGSASQVLEQPSPLVVLPSSHCSPASTTPLPHTGAQSLSSLALAPFGQQPSPLAGSVIAAWAHAAVQVPPFSSVSLVHALPSSQLVGQAPGRPA